MKLADVTPAEVAVSQSLYAEITKLLAPFKSRVNVDVAAYFLDLSSYRAARAARWAFEDDDAAGVSYSDYQATQQVANTKSFFHWQLEFPEVFINRDRVDWRQDGGFDAIVGNPPYDVLAEKEREEDLSHLISYFGTKDNLQPALGRKLDLFRLFTAQAANLMQPGGIFGFITPMSLLADQHTLNLRRYLLTQRRVLRIEVFPQKDDPTRRVFSEAKLPTCVIIVGSETLPVAPIRVAVHPGRLLEEVLGKYQITPQQIEQFDPKSLTLPILTSQSSVTLAVRLASAPHLQPMANVLQTFQGEINETTMRELLSLDSSVGPKVLRGGNVQRYEFVEKARQGTDKYLNVRKYRAKVGGERAKHTQQLRIGYQRNAALDNWKRLIFGPLPCPSYCFDSVSYYLADDKSKACALLALLNSRLLEWRFRLTSTNNHVSTGEIAELPNRCVNFTTSKVESQRNLAELTSQYKQNQDSALLAAVETFLPKDADGNFLAFAPDANGSEEKSDVVHDLLAYLAQQLIDLNKQKQAEQERFLDWLEASLHVQPDNQGRIGLDTLTGKTKIFGYLGDYQKDEPETPWPEIEDVLFKNKRHIGANLNDTRFIARLRAEYEKSLDTLRPIKAQLGRTDWLIDQVVYRLYGLTEEEIAVVEGRT
jgi:Alw26I/Eco31I/Esp3I family type II restriction m6 adenine DNA methyltransferase